MGPIELIIRISLLAIPLYMANSFACLGGGKTPIDMHGNWHDGQRILGPGKTFKGFIAGVVAGTLGGAIIYYIFPIQTNLYMGNYILLSFLLSFGAVFGDILGSFIKRRLRIQRGNPVLFLDQFDFLAIGLLFGAIAYVPSIYEIAVLAIVTFFAHKIGNMIGYLVKVKREPW